MAPPPTAALRDALDRLRVEPAEPPTLWEKLAHGGPEPLPGVPLLDALDADLRRAGVHTLADARLLGRLAQSDPRAKALGEGLRKRARKAQAELDALIAALGREKRRTGNAPVSAIERADAEVEKLERALAIERALGAPQAHAPDDAQPLDAAARFALRPNRPPAQGALLEVIEHYAARAQAEPLDLRRKRRDLDRAHGLLLGLSTALHEGDHHRAQQLRLELAEARHQLAAVEPLVRPGESLALGITRALQDGRADAAYQGLLSVYRSALAGGHSDQARASREALGHLWQGPTDAHGEAAAGEDDARRTLSARLGDGALRALLDDQARNARDPLTEAAYGLVPEHLSAFNLALSAGEFFDASATDEVDEGDPALAQAPKPPVRVPYPTPQVDFALARSLGELRDFVIRDPRLILYDVASGTQLVRAYYEPPDPTPKKTRRSAVRVYVCDASGSMRGARARFRDAILMAELNNLTVRARAGKEVWPIYYAYFTDQPQPLRRVDAPAAAYDLIGDLFERSPARGRTDITWALVAAFEAIHTARGRDPDLARATVVLITDGEDQVDLAQIGAARAPVGDLEITLNFLSLGEENPDLRALVLEQRRGGRRAFYTHLSDDDIAAGSAQALPGLRTLLPETPELALTADSPEVKRALDALAALGAEAPVPQGPRAATRLEVYFPGQIARAPRPVPAGVLLRVADLLTAVAETLALAPADERADEAVTLLEHLLGLYQVSLDAYREALGADDAEIVRQVARVRRLCGVAAIPMQREARTA